MGANYDNIGIPPIITDADDPTIEGQGFFVAGSTATFFFTFPDLLGDLYDPSDINLSIIDPGGTEVESADALDKLDLGVFAHAWSIPKTATPGGYALTLTYTVETIDGDEIRTITENFVVGEEIPASIYSPNRKTMRSYLETLLSQTQRIPNFGEIGRLNKAKTVAKFSFPRWNQPAGINLYINQQIKESGFEVDWLRGRIIFDNALSRYDEVTADYNFRWFTSNELDGFIDQGINIVNIYPPQTLYNITNIHNFAIWGIVAEYSAAADALRSWMMNIQFQEPVKIFGGLNSRKEIFQNLMDLKKNYEETRDKLLEQKKYGPYAGLTKTVTTPEFTLPGGRSRWFRYLFSTN